MSSSIRNYASISKATIEHQGRTHTLKEWTQILDLDYVVVRMRYTRGKRGADLLHPTPSKASTKMKEKDYKTLPSIIHVFDVDTRLALLHESDSDKMRMYDIINKAVKTYLNT
jgi:hypothetical protein